MPTKKMNRSLITGNQLSLLYCVTQSALLATRWIVIICVADCLACLWNHISIGTSSSNSTATNFIFLLKRHRPHVQRKDKSPFGNQLYEQTYQEYQHPCGHHRA
jgi:hypothetical protein